MGNFGNFSNIAEEVAQLAVSYAYACMRLCLDDWPKCMISKEGEKDLHELDLGK